TSVTCLLSLFRARTKPCPSRSVLQCRASIRWRPPARSSSSALATRRSHSCSVSRRPRDLRLSALTLYRLENSRPETEQLCDRLVATALDELLAGGLQRILVGDSGRGLHHLGERPVGDAFAVGQRASLQNRRAFRAGKELA